MGKFDHLGRLEVEAELRRIETIPQKFWGEDIYALRDRLAQIEAEEVQAAEDQAERRHKEQLALAQDQLDRQLIQNDKHHREQIDVAKRQSGRAEVLAWAALVVAIAAAAGTWVQTYYMRPTTSTTTGGTLPHIAQPTPQATPTASPQTQTSLPAASPSQAP